MALGEKLGQFIGNIAPALGPIGAIGGAILANRANKKLAQYSHNKNVEMWKMQNEYNSPAQQMARFKSAGLNPQMIYDKGTAGNAQTMPQYQVLPSSGDVFGQSIAGLQGLVGIQQKKEDLAIAKINRHIADNTKGYKEKVQMYQSMMANTEYWQKELGFDTADQTVKIIAQSMLRRQTWQQTGLAMPDDEEMMLNVLKGITITKDIAKALTGLGFGAIVGRATRAKTINNLSNRKVLTKTGKR